MAQGSAKLKRPPASKGSQLKRQREKVRCAPKGNPLQLRQDRSRLEDLEDRDLTRAINKANEQKMAAKVIQGGSLKLSRELLQSGKELARDLRRDQVKRKVGRVEQKLEELKKKDPDLVL